MIGIIVFGGFCWGAPIVGTPSFSDLPADKSACSKVSSTGASKKYMYIYIYIYFFFFFFFFFLNIFWFV